MLEWLSSCAKTRRRVERSRLKGFLDDYLGGLAARHYPLRTIRTYAGHLLFFGEFLQRQGVCDPVQFPQWVEPFLAQLLAGHRHAARAQSTITCFLRHLRHTGVISATEVPAALDPHAELVEAYCTSLHELRALSHEAIRHIRATCQALMAFLADEGTVALDTVQPAAIHRFIVAQGQRCGRNTLKVRCSALRGFLAYLHRCEVTPADLSAVVVAPRVYQHDKCPRFLTRPEIEAVLSVINRETPVGRRDYAMMLLLAVYGLRGIEVVRLRLDDIDWQHQKLHICRRKAGNSTTYPLAASVGEALIAYLRNGRPASQHREVFLSVLAPYRPLFGNSSLASHIVKYLKLAGVTVERPGTHLFRYSCAQRLFEEGVPLKHIGDYLGHGHAGSTQRYTKIAIDQLREVASGDGEDVL